MITHENLVEAVYLSSGTWSCPDGEKCPYDYSCKGCAGQQVTEYENDIRADERKKVLEDHPIHESELHEILQDIVCAQMMINRTVSRLNRHFNGTHSTKKEEQT